MARVLLVDDDPTGLEVRTLVLARAGHRVFAAADTDGARFLFMQAPPDIVVLDLRIPEVEDGLALIRDFCHLKAEIRIIVLSGWIPDLDGRPEAALVERVLAKPVRSEKLLEAIGGGEAANADWS